MTRVNKKGGWKCGINLAEVIKTRRKKKGKRPFRVKTFSSSLSRCVRSTLELPNLDGFMSGEGHGRTAPSRGHGTEWTAFDLSTLGRDLLGHPKTCQVHSRRCRPERSRVFIAEIPFFRLGFVCSKFVRLGLYVS